MNGHFAAWREKTARTLKALKPGFNPRQLVNKLAEDLLAHYAGRPLIDAYDVYQHLMDYWEAVMQDDCYLIADGGWKAETYRVIETKKGKDGKTGKPVDKGWACDLVPKSLIVARYFAEEQAAVDRIAAELQGVTARLAELEEEQGGEDGAFAELDKVNRANVVARLKELDAERRNAVGTPGKAGSRRRLPVAAEPATAWGEGSEGEALSTWLDLSARESELKRRLKEAESDLDRRAYAQYAKLTEAEVKTLVVDDKWLAVLDAAIHGEMDRVSQALTQRVKELAERYEAPVPELTAHVAALEARVSQHLMKMGFSWT